MFATLRSLVADLMDDGSEHSLEHDDYWLAAAALLMRALQELELPAWTQARAPSFWADFAARHDSGARAVS